MRISGMLKYDFYIESVDIEKELVRCACLPEMHELVVPEIVTRFNIPIKSNMIRSIVGALDDQFFTKKFKKKDFSEKSMRSDDFEMVYNAATPDNIHNANYGYDYWIDVPFRNTHIHGYYLRVNHMLHPWNKAASAVEITKQTVEGLLIDSNEKFAHIVFKYINKIKEENMILVSSENESILIRYLKKLDGPKKGMFKKYFHLESLEKEHSELSISMVLSKVRQTLFRHYISGYVTHEFVDRNGQSMYVLENKDNSFLIPSELVAVSIEI